MPSEDLKQYATSEVDFYELLGITLTSSETDIRRAYRRTALKYHPDKNADNPSAIEKFHLLQIANDVLSDAEVRALYDNARTAREARKRQHELFEGKRKQMKEDLERREGGVKRKRGEEEDERERLEREIRRLAEDGRRRRKERDEMLSREKLEEQVKADEDQSQSAQATQSQGNTPEVDRSVKVRWVREDEGGGMGKDELSALFSRFGEVESTFLLKDKKKKTDGGKKVIATGIVVFKSIVAAHAAISDASMLKAERSWLSEILWASGIAPALDGSTAQTSPEGKQVPHSDGYMSFMGGGTASNTLMSSSGPSFEEVTLMRLKNAERKRLEEQIRKAEAAEDSTPDVKASETVAP